MEQKTLERVDTEGLIEFLRSDVVALTSRPTADGPIIITDQVFDFSNLNDFHKRKVIQIISDGALLFERCIFIGSLWIKDSDFEFIAFKNCFFIKPNFGKTPDQFESLAFTDVSTKLVKIENCILDYPLSITGASISKMKFDYLTCPRLWLQGIYNPKYKELSIFRFSGRRIYLPDQQFRELNLDDIVLRQVEGNKANVRVNYPDLT